MTGSILAELTALLDALGIPVETGVFKGKAPHAYVVITPLADTFGGYADNYPFHEIQEARLSLFSKQNYRALSNKIVKALLDADITITDRRYLGYEEDSEYFHYILEVAQYYEWGE